MDLEKLAATIAKRNAEARSLMSEWSSKITQAMMSETGEILSELIDDLDRTAEGSTTEAPGSSGQDSSMDDDGGVQLATEGTGEAGGERDGGESLVRGTDGAGVQGS